MREYCTIFLESLFFHSRLNLKWNFLTIVRVSFSVHRFSRAKNVQIVSLIKEMFVLRYSRRYTFVYLSTRRANISKFNEWCVPYCSLLARTSYISRSSFLCRTSSCFAFYFVYFFFDHDEWPWTDLALLVLILIWFLFLVWDDSYFNVNNIQWTQLNHQKIHHAVHKFVNRQNEIQQSPWLSAN